jgi:hypothetical protein
LILGGWVVVEGPCDLVRTSQTAWAFLQQRRLLFCLFTFLLKMFTIHHPRKPEVVCERVIRIFYSLFFLLLLRGTIDDVYFFYKLLMTSPPPSREA